MKTYIIGDIQGCYYSLMSLLEQFAYRPGDDRLILLGDIVNRGSGSLEVLRFAANTPRVDAVLGNHDLHLLANYYQLRKSEVGDTLDAILQAPDQDVLIQWLIERPFSIILNDQAVCVHAGIPPRMSFDVFQSRTRDLHAHFMAEPARMMQAIESLDARKSLKNAETDEALANVLTRIRFCEPSGEINFVVKGPLEKGLGQGLRPWYDLLHPSWQSKMIFFGHWAALQGDSAMKNRYALDTGCVWGEFLTAHRFDDGQQYQVKADKRDLCR